MNDICFIGHLREELFKAEKFKRPNFIIKLNCELFDASRQPTIQMCLIKFVIIINILSESL